MPSQTIPLEGLAELLVARAGTALGLKQLLHPGTVSGLQMNWKIEVVAAAAEYWFELVSNVPGGASKYRRIGAAKGKSIRTGYFYSEEDCELDLFSYVPQPCLVITVGAKRFAVRVWDIVLISRVE